MLSDITISSPTTLLHRKSKLPHLSNQKAGFFQVHFVQPLNIFAAKSLPSSLSPLKCCRSEEIVNKNQSLSLTQLNQSWFRKWPTMLWSGVLFVGLLLRTGIRRLKLSIELGNSGRVPGVGLVHAPMSLLPTLFPESHWKQACEVAPIFNELIDRVSLDGKFLQDSLSRTKKVDAFTSKLLDIHAKMLYCNKKEDICLGLHRSDYMLDGETNSPDRAQHNFIFLSWTELSC